LKVLVGSRNPVKIGAVEDVFERYFSGLKVEGVEVASGVPDQPVGDDTFTGARNRALALVTFNREQHLGAAYCAGLEGGVAQLAGRWFAFGAICLANSDGRYGFGVSPMFELAPALLDPLLQGEELGHVVDRLTGDYNTKQKGGAISYLTQGRLGRRELYAQGVVMALVPFLNSEMYDGSSQVFDRYAIDPAHVAAGGFSDGCETLHDEPLDEG
jgi:inosine/xanthosine triphosphatase